MPVKTSLRCGSLRLNVVMHGCDVTVAVVTMVTASVRYYSRPFYTPPIFYFYPRDAMLVWHMLSSCIGPSACLSVASRCSITTAKRRITKTTYTAIAKNLTVTLKLTLTLILLTMTLTLLALTANPNNPNPNPYPKPSL